MQNNLLENLGHSPVIEKVFERIDETFEHWVGLDGQMQSALPINSKYLRHRQP